MPGKQFKGTPEGLRRPERIRLLDVENVTDLVLAGMELTSVLDVGVGSGIFAEAFARRGLQVAGVDINPTMIEAARKAVPTGEFRQGLLEELPYRAAMFDLVFMSHVLHETAVPLKALQEARRVGMMRIAILEWPYREQPYGPPLSHRVTSEQVLRWVQEAGLPAAEEHELEHMTLFRIDLDP